MAYLMLLAGIFFLRPNGALQKNPAWSRKAVVRIAGILVLAATIALLVYPMTLPTYWNGTKPAHRNQYEVMAKSLLNGHIYMDYTDIDPKLGEMENPYDPAARKAAGVRFHWDHAWYNGHYYMYFGIVPVLLLFLPYRAITGLDLTTYIATALFASGGAIGIFLLFREIAKRFFEKLPAGVVYALSFAVSIASFYYSAKAPALYCTAVSSALCMMIFSFFFYFKAVFVAEKAAHQTVYAVLGASFGALAIGCRPTIAVANLIAIPMLVYFLRHRKFTGRVALQVAAAVMPYVIVLALLGVYNYARFGNPLEFGQAYQLTLADQSAYSGLFAGKSLGQLLKGVVETFFFFGKSTDSFPWIGYSGVFVNFPFFLASVLLFLPKTVVKAKKEKLLALLIVTFLTPFVIALLDGAWSPVVLERYRSDVYYLVGTASFLAIGAIYERTRNLKMQALLRTAFGMLALLVVVSAFALYVIPNDGSYTAESAENLAKVKKVLFFIF